MTLVSKTRLATLALVAASLLAPTASFAQDTSTFRATVYGFVPSLVGDTAFQTPLGNSFDINRETLIENTDFALMGLLEVQKGRIGGFVDAMYFNLGTSKTATREVALPGAPIALPIKADAQLDIEAWVSEAALNIRALAGRAGHIDVFGGARRLEAIGTLNYAFSSPLGAGPQGVTEATNANWDAIGGVRGRVRVGPLTIPYYADAGAGDSDLTWQVMTGVGYEMRHFDVGVMWRHIDYRMKGERQIADLELNGPSAGITFKW